MSERNDDRFNLDLYSLFTDVLKNLWAILLGAIAAVLIADLMMTTATQKTYSTKATFVVTSKNYSSNAYRNLSAAQNMADTLTNILNSEVLKKEVCKDLNLDQFDASVRASVINETNLLELRVTAKSPLLTFQITRSIMENYSELTQYVNEETIMQVLEEPYVPTSPNTGIRDLSQLKRVFVIALLILIFAFLFLSYRHDTIKSELDLNSKLDAKALGVIDHESRKKILGKKVRPLVSNIEVSFGFVEQYKKITSRLLTLAQNNDSHTIMITSVQEHEGKSNVAANIALTMKQQGFKVLLVDCDMRRPVQAEQFSLKVDKEKDIAAIIEERVQLSDSIFKKNDMYYVMCAGYHKNSTELVSSVNMKKFLQDASDIFDYVIIDTPPMAVLGDAEALANIVDMSVLVVQYNKVLSEDINDAIDALNSTSSVFAGTVLNNQCYMPGAGKAAVSKGYGRYGHYGKYGSYGRYGRYGNYGRYGHYAERKNTAAESADEVNS